MRGGSRKGSGKAATGRSTEVLHFRVSQETYASYQVLTPAQKRSLNRLVCSMVKVRYQKALRGRLKERLGTEGNDDPARG